MKRLTLVFALLTCLLAPLSNTSAQVLPDKNGFAPTRLTHKGPAPQPYEAIPERALRQKIEYPSGDLRLAGWLASPKKPNGSAIAVVYLHGGFSLSEEDMNDAQPFLDAGYPVLFPALRAENGNPGHFELMRGEVDDALAAATWLARSDGGSRPKVVIFGHSIGGGTAELTALQASDAVLLSGSVGALYPPQIFSQFGELPFDRQDKAEVASRIFLANVTRMKRRHLAYMGKADAGASMLPNYRALFEQAKAPVTVQLVPGDHHGSVRPAIQAFLQEMAKEASQ